MPAKFLGAWGEGTPTTTPPPSNTGGIPHLHPIARRDGLHMNRLPINHHGKNESGTALRRRIVSRETLLRCGRFTYEPYA